MVASYKIRLADDFDLRSVSAGVKVGTLNDGIGYMVDSVEQTFEFGDLELIPLPFGIVVTGRCWAGEFGVGDVFSELHWKQSELLNSPPMLEHVAEDIAAEIHLRAIEITAYSQHVERVYPGMVVFIRFGDAPLTELLGIDFDADRQALKSWSLWGQRRS